MTIRRVELELDQIGCGKVVIDGIDMSPFVQAIQINAKAHEVSQILISAPAAHGPIAISGEVLQVVEGAGEAATLEFLQSASLELLGIETDSVAEAMLATLQKWAVASADDGT
jgi:hypothetical protein